MSLKHQHYLRRKTKRENFEEINIIEKPKTTIKLISLNDNNYNDKDYSYIKFSSSDKISLNKLVKNKKQIIKLDIDSGKICAIDKIELGNEKGTVKESFLLPIYLKKTNTCYISLKLKKKGYCFELIFYGKNKNAFPNNLLYKNSQKLDEFDDYNLRRRKKIIAINVEKNFAKDYLKNLTLSSNSYEISARINEIGEILPSVQELILEEVLSPKQLLIKANLNNIKKIYQLFDEFKNKKSLKDLKIKYKNIIDDNTFNNFIAKYTCIHTSYLEIQEINENDVNLLKENLLKLILKYFFIELETNINKIQAKKINDMILIMITNIKSIIDDIELFSKNSDNPTTLKFRLYRGTLYNIYSVIKKKSSNKLSCLKMLCSYHQQIINLKKCSKNNPYFEAVKFLKEVAKNLNENSSFFDFLMKYNSEISLDIDLLRRKRKNNDNIYHLNMLTVEEVSNLLKELLPDFIIRYTFDNDVYSFYSILDDLIFLNEKKTFKNNSINNYDGLMEYTLPIVILLIHESWEFKKIDKSNKITKISPFRNYLRNEDFIEEEYFIFYKNGESGLELKYLITGLRYENIFSEYLLSSDDMNNVKLLDVKLWIQPDFKELQNIIRINCEKIYDSDIDELIKENKDLKDRNNTRRYGLETFEENGVIIGPFFKV